MLRQTRGAELLLERLMRPALSPALLVALALGVLGSAHAQIPLSPRRDSGQSVTPAYEGWYPNEDGTISLSFGYYNRNSEEVVEIPIGPNNFISPGAESQGQPSEFHPQRHWGVFTITVPGDFGDQRVVWTLTNRGQTFAIPAHTHRDWLLDAKLNPASGNTPPKLKFDPEGATGTGPDGITVGPVNAKVGVPHTLKVWATDDEVGSGSLFRRQEHPILLAWFKHTGPGSVEFEPQEPLVDKAAGGESTTAATFSAPGDYVLRLRAVDLSGLRSGGHSQCCWTNGFVKVTVQE